MRQSNVVASLHATNYCKILVNTQPPTNITLIHFYPPLTRDVGTFSLSKSSTPAEELTVFQAFRLRLDFFPHKFAACSKPPSRDNHRKCLIQGHNNVTRVQVKPRSCNQDHHENNAFILSDILSTN